MNRHKFGYIYALVLPAVLLAGCNDDDLIPDNSKWKNPDAVTFETKTVGANPFSRGLDTPEYQPLVLTSSEADFPLYLHTYETTKIGMRPGEEADALTRGVQVTSADALITFHKNFKVLANTFDGGEHFLGWADTHPSEFDSSIWFTERTEYWPSQTKLAFYALSPSEEFDRVNPAVEDNTISFYYEARRGNANKDAELQPDLMLAASACTKATSIAGSAPLNFHHALSAVKFAVRDVTEGTVVNIEIANVHAAGNCTFTTDMNTGLGNFEWVPTETTTTYSQDFNYKVNDRGVIDVNDAGKDLVINDGMPEKTFMLIPQVLPDDAEIIVTLNRKKLDNSGGNEVVKLRGKIKSNLVEQWEAGHEYVYTISTSADNWTYVFEVFGNHRGDQPAGEHDIWDGDHIYVYSPMARKEIGDGIVYMQDLYGNKAHAHVRSYRYRTNKPSYVEETSWTASNTGTGQYTYIGGNEGYVAGRDLTAEEWLLDQDKLHGDGNSSEEGERIDFEFLPQSQISSWPGDSVMQANPPYADIDEEHAWDLSTCGSNNLSRNTANCYVIDRGGWYKFPLVFGNGYKNGKPNVDAYTYMDTAPNSSIPILKNFKHSQGFISKPEIDGVVDAKVIWSDVNSAITNVTTDGEYIKFEAVQNNLLQGSVIIAALDISGTILWSWHIWITEHYLDPVTGVYNAFQEGGEFAHFDRSSSGWRNRGDIKVDNAYVSGDHNFMVAPYNLGWCDPKNVDYLRRHGTMTFVQYGPDGKPTGKVLELPIIQDGVHVEFREGNNTYYQFGRKDPFIGYIDHTSTQKRNFTGENNVEPLNKYTTIEDAINHPWEFYYHPDKPANGDWNSSHYVNLWNNKVPSSIDDYSVEAQKGIKTVYDPCPPGYMVPPSYFMRFIGPDGNNSFGNMGSEQSKDKWGFNGELVADDPYTFLACAVDPSKQTDENTIWLTSTGERWDKPGVNPSGFVVKNYNFNPHIVYLWSSHAPLTGDAVSNAYCMALGYDDSVAAGWVDPDVIKIKRRANDGTLDKYCICSFFIGRRTMARPIRPIRESREN